MSQDDNTPDPGAILETLTQLTETVDNLHDLVANLTGQLTAPLEEIRIEWAEAEEESEDSDRLPRPRSRTLH